ncbi:MAG: Rieske 2Fe-2S domain-containing protein [Chloroflexota bacterium]
MINRREFLYYIWLGISALFIGHSGLTIFSFLFPPLPESSHGVLPLGKVKDIWSTSSSSPILYERNNFWLVYTDSSILALYNVCPHLGCLVYWSEISKQFQCSCHGSKFALDGTLLSGPASRNLDRLMIRAYNGNNEEFFLTDREGNPLPVSSEQVIEVEVKFRIRGKTV